MGKRVYRGEDLLLASHLHGDHARLEAETRLGLAVARAAEATDGEPSEAELDEATDAWRYERDLLSADDTQAWLKQRRLRTDEWLDHILRSTLRRQRPAADLARLSKRYRIPPADIEGALYAEAACSGVLTRVADRLAGQAAIYAREIEEGMPHPTKAALAKVVATLPAGVRRSGIVGLSPAATRERAEHIAAVSLVYARFVDGTADPAALRHEIDSHALDWTRVEGSRVSFSSQEAAREAALLVRQDGLSLSRAAALAGTRVEKARYVFDETDEHLRDRLLGAAPGDLIGPVAVGGSFALIAVQKRVEPSLRDKTIRARAVDAVIGRTIQREIGRRVRWHERI